MVAKLGKDVSLIKDAGSKTGILLEHQSPLVGRHLAHPDLGEGWRRTALTLQTNHLLAHVLQQLLGDIGSIPHASHHHPFLGFRSSCMGVNTGAIRPYASVSAVKLSR
jgi:hypothetical protein